MIFSALVEFINYCVGKSTRFLDDDDIWKSASYQIEQDLSKVNTRVLVLKSNLFQNRHRHTFSSYFPPTFESLIESLNIF